jgi:exopolyphosphatase / guanosine-5'-triphosphate,3'-diphosphate pyrophosphatase
MPARISVIDLGTNTFNLLIAEYSGIDSFKILVDSKLPVKLGEGGIQQGIILDQARARAFDALGKHIKTIEEFKVSKILAFGTSALRSARNGADFAQEIYTHFGFKVNIISGEREAELIYKGISLSVKLDEKPHLILDIGGGSNEFILCNGAGIHWKESYPLGMARMLEKFKPSDPVQLNEIGKMEDFFDRNLPGLYTALSKHHTRALIGASGSFETFASLLRELFPSKYFNKPGQTSLEIQIEDFFLLHDKLIKSTSAERLLMKGMVPMRVDMIVPASIFVTFILKKCSIKKLVQSDYSLKEGVLHEQMLIQ